MEKSGPLAHGNKHKLTTRFDYFETEVRIAGSPYVVSFDVEVFPNVNNYRTHRINKIELSPVSNADPGPVPGASETETAPIQKNSQDTVHNAHGRKRQREHFTGRGAGCTGCKRAFKGTKGNAVAVYQ